MGQNTTWLIDLKNSFYFLYVSTIRSACHLTLRVPWLLQAAWTPWLNYGMLRVGKRRPHWQYVSSCGFSVFLFNRKHSHLSCLIISPSSVYLLQDINDFFQVMSENSSMRVFINGFVIKSVITSIYGIIHAFHF